MNSADLERIERLLGIVLPLAYESAAVAGRLSLLLNADPTSVIAINQGLRRGDFGDTAWRYDVFAFADDGGGNMFCLDLNDDRVLSRDHETLGLLLVSNDFNEWLASQ